MEKEDGEMSDDCTMVIAEYPMSVKENTTELSETENNGLTIETLLKIDAAKIEERAKKLGLNLTGHRLITQTQIDELYTKSGIESGNERHFRFDTLHLYGIDGLTSRDIFEYLEDYHPIALEKVDDTSCNVVCQDHITAALALLVHSREIRNDELKQMLSEKSDHHWREGMPHPKNDLILMRFGTNSDKKVAKSRVQPKLLEEPYDQSMDPISKNPWGDLCRSWGVYDHQEVFERRFPENDYQYEDEMTQRRLPDNDYQYEDDLEITQVPLKIRNKKLAMRLGKRRQEPQSEDSSDSDIEWKKKSKTPRMRMHADDEESKIKSKKIIKVEESDDEYDGEKQRARSRTANRNTFAPLSIQLVNTSRSNFTPKAHTKLSDQFRFHKSTVTVPNDRSQIQERLGVKVVRSMVEKHNITAEESLSSSSDDNDTDESDDHNIMSRVQKVSNTKSVPTVWSRLRTHSFQSPSQSHGTQKDLRQVIKTKKLSNTDDLRQRIRRPKRANIRIEIDNN